MFCALNKSIYRCKHTVELRAILRGFVVKFHDALIHELIKPTRHGEPTGKIIRIVGTKKIKYQLEEAFEFQKRATHSLETIVDYMTPDIVVTRLKPLRGETPKVVIEVETDIAFDFAKSLRQVKKYKKITPDVHVVIPKEYDDFAPLYKSQGFRIWFWKAKRKYECLRCKSTTEIEGPYKPRCSTCNKYIKHRLVDLVNADFLEFTI